MYTYKNNFEDYILRVIMAFTCKCIIKVIFGVNEKLKKKEKTKLMYMYT